MVRIIPLHSMRRGLLRRYVGVVGIFDGSATGNDTTAGKLCSVVPDRASPVSVEDQSSNSGSLRACIC